MHFSKAQFAESKTARWKSLPNKKQLAILFFARFVDVVQNTSLQTYIYYQLQSFQPESPDTTISTKIGWVLGIFAAAQALTALIWARLADSKLFGRKRSLWIGLFGNCVSCVGIGVSKSFGQIACWRILAGTMNATGTIVTVMLAELVQEEELQPHAFLLLTLAQNSAALIGPESSHWEQIHERSKNGGEPPAPRQFDAKQSRICILYAISLFDAKLPECRVTYGGWFLCLVWASREQSLDRGIPDVLTSAKQVNVFHTMKTGEENASTRSGVWTKRMVLVLAAQASLDFHIAAFNHLWPVFLSTPSPATDNAQAQATKSRKVAGLGLSSSSVGFVIAMIGGIGLIGQITLYSRITIRFGSVKCYQWFSILAPIAYALAPILALFSAPTVSAANHQPATLWIGITVVLLFQVTGRVFSIPAAIVLLNSCVPHPSKLSTIHAIGMVVSSAFRTLGPISSGYIYSASSSVGNAILPWWTLSLVSLSGCVALFVIPAWCGEKAKIESAADSFEL
ncbi:hypothetical protein BP6252_11511 [Coleophoma cylindrospora]|uniref:Major facilitator superfamily (MFS) profile domain-containing protein n=1 Tax=Coleophoma cylindrospora TaxID=1849047 RepID=A0A3D8QK31_9HELO|nr:hypothetical protein BP6252_11511 [Coleophoma cylindrospora]